MKKNLLFSALAVLFLWLAWVIAYFIVRNEYILPSFWGTISAAARLFTQAAFWRAFGNTLLRTLWAFALSLLLGVGLAVPACVFRGVRAFFAPIISVLRTVPTLAIILVLLIWTNPRVAPVVVAVLVLMPAFYAAALAAFDEVDKGYGDLARVFGVSRKRRVFKMYLPLAAPPVLGQAGGILSMGLKITVSAEVLSSTYRSLGGMMQEAKIFVDMPTLLALTVLTVALGFLLEGACALVNLRLGRRLK